jgi:hypothetical protein
MSPLFIQKYNWCVRQSQRAEDALIHAYHWCARNKRRTLALWIVSLLCFFSGWFGWKSSMLQFGSGGNAIVTSCTPNAGTSCTLLATPSFGNLIVAAAYRGNSATAPTTATGYTVAKSATGNTNSIKVGWKLAVGNETTCGTWANATQTMCEVYSGNWIASAGPIGTATSGTTGSSTSVSYPTFTLNNPLSTSWVACAGGATSATSGMAVAPSGMTLRSGTSIASIAFSDTNGNVSTWSTTTVTVSPTSVWATACIEIIGSNIATNASSYLVEQAYPTQSGQACTSPCTITYTFPIKGGSLANNELNLVQYWNYTGTAPTITSVYCNSDTGHATWTWSSVKAITDPSDLTDMSMYHIDGAAPGCQTVTVAFSTGTTFTSLSGELTEWRQIATSSAIDVSAGQEDTAGTPANTAGAFTPTVNGDVIYDLCMGTNLFEAGFAAVPNYGPSGSNFLAADSAFSSQGSAFVQTTAAAVTPYVWLTGNAADTVCIAVAMKASAGAGTAPSGEQVVQQTQTVGASATTSQIEYALLNGGDTAVFVGTTGNVPSTDQACTVITDGLNTWTIKQNTQGSNSYPMMAFNSNANAGNGYALLSSCHADGNQNWTFFEISGALNSSSTASWDSGMGVCSATGSGTPYSSAPGSCVPSTSNGVMISEMLIGTGPFSGISSPTCGLYNWPTYPGVTDTSYMTEGGGLSICYNTTTAGESWTWTGNPNNAAWGASANAFEAQPSSNVLDEDYWQNNASQYIDAAFNGTIYGLPLGLEIGLIVGACAYRKKLSVLRAVDRTRFVSGCGNPSRDSLLDHGLDYKGADLLSLIAAQSNRDAQKPRDGERRAN